MIGRGLVNREAKGRSFASLLSRHLVAGLASLSTRREWLRHSGTPVGPGYEEI